MPRLIAVCASLLLCCGSLAAGEKRIVAYFAEWSVYGRKYNIPDIPADKITHLIYAFAKIDRGEVALGDSYAAIDKFYPGDKWDAGQGTRRVARGSFHQLPCDGLRRRSTPS